MRDRARAVVIGGGVGGCPCSTTSRSSAGRTSCWSSSSSSRTARPGTPPGLVGQLRSTVSLTRMMMYSVGLYGELARETGKDPGWHQLGGLRLASSPARLEEIQRQNALGAHVRAADGDRLGGRRRRSSSRRCRPRACSPPRTCRTTATSIPSQLTFALADGARRLGAEIETRTQVTGDRAARRARRGRRDRQGPDRVRRGRQRRRHVRAGGRPAGRRRRCRSSRSATSTSSPSRSTRRSSRCRRCATRTTSSTSAPRSAAS